ADRALGSQGLDGRGQGRRAPRRHAAGHRAPGGGRARAAREDHRRRRRVPGGREAVAGGQHHQPEPGHAPAPLPADPARHRGQPELDDRLPAAARHGEAVRGARSDVKRSATFLEHAGQLTGPEVRIDQLTGLRAILAPARADRPDAFAPAPARTREGEAESCPFCEGREDRTPPEVWAARAGGGQPDSPGWTARAVPNLYPVLSSAYEAEGGPSAAQETGLASSVDPLRASSRGRQPDLFASQPALGAHEVIIHAPGHVTSLAELGEERFAGAVAAWRERMRFHAHEAAFVH